MTGQVVDTATAREFMAETLKAVDTDELSRISRELEDKARWFGERLGAAALDGLGHGELEPLLRRIFATRGKTRAALLAADWGWLRSAIAALLHGDGAPDARFRTFVGELGERTPAFAANLRCDFASELLHFTDPDRHWLWTRWMWDPRTRTGALPLVTTAAYDLSGDDPGEVYLKVGRAIAFVHETGDAAGFRSISRSVFGTDVFLCCVYAVYTYTVLRMRMTKEFNKVMPKLPELSRRLLGVHRTARAAGAGPGVGDG